MAAPISSTKVIYQRSIGQTSYERQRTRLREQVTLAEIELHDAALDQLDVEGVLAFSEHLLSDPARIRLEASPEQKQRLQKAFFPEGLAFDGVGFGTAASSLLLSHLATDSADQNALASLSIPSWNQVESFLRSLSRLKELAGSAA